MTMTKTCEGATEGDWSGVGLGSIRFPLGAGLTLAGAWAVALGAQAASKQAATTRATSRIFQTAYDPRLT